MIKSVIAICPKCSAKNAWNIYGKDIFETTVPWFMCSFCYKPSDVDQWQQEGLEQRKI